MLRCKPAERITTSAALESEWMKKWDLPALKAEEIASLASDKKKADFAASS
jgi:hypothetical protein